MEPELESRYFHLMGKWYWRLGSVALCFAAAGLLALGFHASSYKSLLPFLFLSVITLVAARFGSWPGIVGTFGAAGIFAVFLFEPVFSLRVSDTAQRSNLIWMALIGIVVSELWECGQRDTFHGKGDSGLQLG